MCFIAWKLLSAVIKTVVGFDTSQIFSFVTVGVTL